MHVVGNGTAWVHGFAFPEEEGEHVDEGVENEEEREGDAEGLEVHSGFTESD